MRARIFAFFILVLLVIVPAGVYYYFTTTNIASIEISVGTGVTASIHLEGTFGVDGLPLADKILTYEASCNAVCQISPILPARYTLTITSSGKTTITDAIIVHTADTLTKSYQLHEDITFHATQHIVGYNQDLVTRMIDTAKAKNLGEFTPIGNDILDRVWVIQKNDTLMQVGILSEEKFTPIQPISMPIITAVMDTTQSAVVINLAGYKSILIPIDLSGTREITTPLDTSITSVVPGKRWYIRTGLGSYELSSESRLVEDVRFTDTIDLSENIRIGYIDKNDTNKLSISNFSLGQSVLIRLDRETGESTLLRNGIDIGGFLWYNNAPAYIGYSGEIFTIEGK